MALMRRKIEHIQRVFRAHSSEIQDYSVRWSVIVKTRALGMHIEADGDQEGVTT
jgi:hypothetical protein